MALNKFPSYEELRNNSPEILKIIEQPIEQWDIVEITWYPWTWKTLVSGLKFTHCNSKNKVYLTYAHMLLAYTKQWLEGSDNIFVFDKYLSDVWRNSNIDYDMGLDEKRELRIESLPFNYWDWKILFLDEAQDIPSDIVAKLSLKFDSIIICWDKDQAIRDAERAWSDFFQDYENDLAKNDPNFTDKYMFRNPWKLYRNYRNTKPIFDFSRQFQPDALPLNDIKIMRQWWERPQLRVWDQNDVLDEISKLCADWIWNQQTIGIVAESTDDIFFIYERLKNSLRNELKNFDESMIYYYISEGNSDKAAAARACVEANVVIATPISMKWLEFDMVVFWKFWQFWDWRNTALKRNVYYVSMTRAKDRLIICQDTESFWSFNVDPSSYEVQHIEWSEETNTSSVPVEDDDEFDLPF